MLAAYQIIEGSRSIADKTAIEAEGNFILRKIDWALNGYTSVSKPSPDTSGDKLEVATSHGTFLFTLEDEALMLNGEPLTNSRVTVADFLVKHTSPSGGTPRAVELSFTIDKEHFGTTTRYLR